MKQEQVMPGRTYAIKVKGHLRPVKVLRESVWGGWDCRDEVTGREIRVKTSARLRPIAQRPERDGVTRLTKADKVLSKTIAVRLKAILGGAEARRN
jgi:hypothetical protein